ncbi:MAG: tyrosine-type recombinase/integrase [Planctomycetes bacterium]|nr:tyrosine-type recombinase/integrase [Planctomycetota bacterium]
MDLRQALQVYLLQLRADGRSPHTIKSYERHLGSLLDWLAKHGRSAALDEITPQVLAEFLVSDHVRASGRGGLRSTSTVNAVRTSLRVVFGWLHDAGHTRVNPARLIRRAICSPPPPKGLSEDQLDRLRSVLANATGVAAARDRAMVALMLGSGLRIGSTVALDAGDVDLANGVLTARCVKRDRVQRVFFGAEARAELQRLIAGLPGPGPLFRAPNGERLTVRQACRRITAWLDRAGIHDASPHSLRHTFATRLLARTGDVFLVQKALGHRSIASTAVYLEVSDERLRDALAVQTYASVR